MSSRMIVMGARTVNGDFDSDLIERAKRLQNDQSARATGEWTKRIMLSTQTERYDPGMWFGHAERAYLENAQQRLLELGMVDLPDTGPVG